MLRAAPLVIVALWAVAARADLAPPPPPPTKPIAEVAAAPVAPAAEGGLKPKKNQRLLCGCASSRFVGLKGREPAVVGDGTLGLWLHHEARVEGFTQGDGRLESAGLPFALDIDERSTGGASRFVRVRATGDGEGFLGIMRAGETSPRDVATVRFAHASASTTMAPAPALQALWLEPPEARERRDCGPWITQRIAFDLAPGSVGVDAFQVTNLDTGASTLVDARHTGAFGIGRVALCDHGFEVQNRPQRVEIAPVSSTGEAGLAWGFGHDGTGTTPVVRLSTPLTADPGQLDEPYPVPGEGGTRISWRSVGGFWIILIVTGVVAVFLAWIAWRLTKRRLAEVVCVSCHKAVPVDVLDEKADGFFCPHCGASGMWKGRSADVNVTRLNDDD